MSEEKKEKEKSAEPTEELKETGSANLEGSRDNHRIKLLTIVGEIEGHEAVSGNTKATKYEHLLPMLAEVEDSSKIDGLLILLNTLGGDVEAGLSIAEMIASLSKGDKIVTSGGFIVEVVKKEEEFFMVRLNDDTIVKLAKDYVAKKVEQ